MPDPAPHPAPRIALPRVVRLTAALGILLTSAVAADVDAMTPAAFAAEMQRIAAEISNAAPDDASRLSAALPIEWTVDVGEASVGVSAVWLRDELYRARIAPAAWPASRDRLVQRLAALQGEALAAGAATTPDGAAARASLEQVLARPEFRRLSTDTAAARLRARLAEWFRQLWTRLGGDRVGLRQTAGWFAWVVALTALGVLVAWIARTLHRAPAAGRFAAPPRGSHASAALWARQALAAADPRETVRCAYRAAVCRLADEGAWRLDEARTPREYLRLLPRDHGRRTIVADVASRFEEVFFGGREATDEDRAVLAVRLKDLGCLPAD